MIKPLLKYYLFIIIFSLSIFDSFAQADLGELFDTKTLENNDTIRTRRTYGTWWFGLTAGGNLQKYYGSIYMPFNLNIPIDVLKNPEYQLKGGLGGGFKDYGIFTEYQPAGGNWGISLRSYISNIRTVSASSDKFEVDNSGGFTKTIQLQTTDPQTTSNINYYTLCPSFRLNLYKGFYFLMGAEIDILKSSLIKRVTYELNPDPVTTTYTPTKYDISPVKTRFGAHFGVGYDLFVLDYNQGNRVMISPYITVGTGTSMYSKSTDGIANPSLSSFDFKFGLSVKFSRDIEYNDTLKFNPEAKEKLDFLASAQIDRGVNYSGFTKQELLETPNISYVAIPEIVEQVKEEPVFANEMAQEKKEVKQEEKVKVVPAEDLLKMKKLFYISEATVQLSTPMKEWLNSVVLYMKEHPKSTVIIDGHSDNRGTPEDNEKRANERANYALKYLMSKSIPKGRIFAKGNGDRKGIGDNRTDEGRRLNRRIEITVKP